MVVKGLKNKRIVSDQVSTVDESKIDKDRHEYLSLAVHN